MRKSECHCRNLRTLTSSWLVPPFLLVASPFQQPPRLSPPAGSFSLSSPSHLRVPPRDSLSALSLPSPFRAVSHSLSLSLSAALSPLRLSHQPSLALSPFFSLTRGSLRQPEWSLEYFRNDSRAKKLPAEEEEEEEEEDFNKQRARGEESRQISRDSRGERCEILRRGSLSLGREPGGNDTIGWGRGAVM